MSRKTLDEPAMLTDEKLFDADFLDRLRSLFFKLRKRRHLKHKGTQSSPASGFTREFKDRRHYSPGDDFRAIDWRLFARLEKTFIRVFEEVQEFHVHILIDRSLSMTEPHREKAVAAMRLAVALAYLGLVNGHRVSLLSMADGTRRESPPWKGQGHIHEVLAKMGAMQFAGATDLEAALKQFRPGRDRRGVVFVISDLLSASPQETEPLLKQMTTWPAETHVIQILHPLEMKPEVEGELRLVDVETGELRRVWLTRREVQRYEKEFADWIDGLRRTCMRNKIDYVTWPTDQPFDDMFLMLLSQGSSLAGK